MTVRANKPAFSIREKLKELDYAHLPYDKMPAGSVIRTEFKQFDTRLAISISGNVPTYYDFSALNITISPVSSSSKFLLHANVVSSEGANPNGGPAFRYTTGGVDYDVHPASARTEPWSLGTNYPFVLVDDLINTSFTTNSDNSRFLTKTYHGSGLVTPNTTNPVTFKLGYYGQASFYVNRNFYDTQYYGSGFTTLTVMEIAG
jgi:hypothetical protein